MILKAAENIYNIERLIESINGENKKDESKRQPFEMTISFPFAKPKNKKWQKLTHSQRMERTLTRYG